MRKRIIPFIFALAVVFLGAFTYKTIVAVNTSSSTATIYVDPQTSTGTVGQNFTININISNVTDLYGWEFKLRWNSTLLDAKDVLEGSFLKQGGNTFFTFKINNTEGYMIVDCTLLGDVSGVSGNGTLATVKFYVEARGECALDLYDTKLVNSSEQSITHTTIDGNFRTIVRDVAITSVTPSKTVVVVGEIVNITVVAKNEGTETETFNVTAYYGNVSIETQAVNNLAADTNTTLIFSWNTTSVSAGNYTIKAIADTGYGETETSYNIKTTVININGGEQSGGADSRKLLR